MGALDLLSAALLWFTLSPLPVAVAQFHAGFLFFKGGGSMINSVPLPVPVYVLGGAADILSAAILFTGSPPVLVGYKNWIAGMLFLKGIWTFLGFMQD